MHSTITLLTFVTASLLGLGLVSLVYDYFFRYRLAVRNRLTEFAGHKDGEVSLFKDINRLQAQAGAGRLTWKERVQRLIEQAGVNSSVQNLIAWSIGAGLVTALGGALRVWWLGILMLPAGMAVPWMALLLRRGGRQWKMRRQLPEAFAMISRAVRAGQTVPAALQIIADDFDPPISAEFALCYEQQNLGMSRESALRKLAARSGVMELQIFVVALLVQSKSGGDLVELLDNLAAMIRKRLKLKDRVRALTGEGRMQAIVLIVLPIAAFLGIIFLAPDYGSVLLDRPWLLVGTGAAQVVGALWIRKIVNFEY